MRPGVSEGHVLVAVGLGALGHVPGVAVGRRGTRLPPLAGRLFLPQRLSLAAIGPSKAQRSAARRPLEAWRTGCRTSRGG